MQEGKCIVKRGSTSEQFESDVPTTIEFGHRTSELCNTFFLFAILLLGFALRCIYFVGIGGYDDISYLKYVEQILGGTFSTDFIFNGEFPFRYRAGILFPTALMFKLFGPSEYVASILPLTVSLLTIWLAFRAGKLFSPTVGLIAALLIATLPIAVISATSLLPTLFSSFFCGLSIVWWIELERIHQSPVPVPRVLRTRDLLAYFMVGVSLGIAYLYRVEASLSGLVFIAFALLWWRPHRGWWFAALGIVIVIGSENLVYYSLHGEWFYRLQVISQGFAEVAALGGTGSPIANAKSPMVYVNALFVKPIDYGLHGAVFVAAALFSIIFVRRAPALRPILLWFWLWLLYLSFGTWSIETYVPTTKNPRYLQNISLPGAVLSAFVITWLLQKGGAIRRVSLVMLCVLLAGSFVLMNPAWIYRYENAAGSRLAADIIRQQITKHRGEKDAVIQAEYYTAANLTHFLPEVAVSPISHADIGVGDTLSHVKEAGVGYVIHDEFIASKYRDIVGYQIPADLLDPPPHWTLISSNSRPNERFQYRVLEYLSHLSGQRVQGFEKSLQDGAVLLYRVNPL